jgi:hypothetical protein
MVTAAALMLLVLLASGAPVRGQQAPSGSEAAAVRAVIDQLFDGMRERNTAKMGATFFADARLFGLSQDGNVRMTPAMDFVASIERAPAGVLLDEVLGEVEIRIDGQLATAWTYYDFFAGDNFSHCGYNAFQMLKAGGEWKIVSITDSRRRDGCQQQRRR